MPDLGDFLGTLLGELTTARLQGDVEALRVADIYANHELLRHLPVPRFRLPEIRIDMPAILEAETKDRGPADTKAIAAAVLNGLQRALDERQLALTRTEDARMSEMVTKVLEQALSAPVSPPAQRVAERIVSELRSISASLSDPQHAGALEDVRDEIARRLVVARASAARISIVPHTGAIREIADGDRLIRIHLVISEEAVEWTVLETASGTKERLVQE